MEIIVAFLSLVLTNNLFMSAAKWLGNEALSKGWLRVLLAIFSIVGVVSSSALSGSMIDYDSISAWIRLILSIVTVGVGSHLSYKAIKEA